MLLYTSPCDHGWIAPEFSLKDPDGVSHSLSQYLGNKGLLIAFISNHCPYVQRIADRLAQDAKILIGEGINVLAIMSNDYENYEADSPSNMKLFARRHGFVFPYLVDEEQTVGKTFNALCTPDFFGLNARGELEYRGRLDDVGMKSDFLTRTPELLNAMRMIAKTGVGPEEQSASMGCSIKWRV